jgi:dipicolinate synthase subunit B
VGEVNLKGKDVGFCITGAYHKIEGILGIIEEVRASGARVRVILSPAAVEIAGRRGTRDRLFDRIDEVTGGLPPLLDLVDVEPIGPEAMFDLLVIAPCTGNTLAKLANAISDGPVTMAAKAQLRNVRPVLLCISTNDGLSMNARNLGILLNARNVYFVPFGQDDPVGKPNSLDGDVGRIPEAAVMALQGRQLQPVLVERSRS